MGGGWERGLQIRNLRDNYVGEGPREELGGAKLSKLLWETHFRT